MVDDKSVAMPMIKNGDRKNCTAVAEFTLSRVSSIRSGNNVFVRYDEGTYDTYFQAPDLYWSIIKKTDRQCMLLFFDRLLYCMCPFFSFAVSFLYGGLCCNGIFDAITNFIFFHLQNVKK